MPEGPFGFPRLTSVGPFVEAERKPDNNEDTDGYIELPEEPPSASDLNISETTYD